LLQLIISGLATGSLYALAGLGLVLIFRTTYVMNFSQGEMAMFSTFVAFFLMNSYGLPYYLAFLLAVVFAVIMGFVVELLLMRPLRKAPPLSPMILTLGLIMVIQGATGLIFGFNQNPFPVAISGRLEFLGAWISRHNIFIIFFALAMMGGLFWFFKYSRHGLAVMAATQNPTTARLMGVDINRVFSLTWMVAVALACVTGILVAPTTGLMLGMMQPIHLKSLTSAVLGGFTTLGGPVFGGFILGVLENLVGYYISTKWKTAFAFALIVVVLMVKPQGLFGKVQQKKV
jgi:branched-chain amino acid transport system permease protein